MNYFVLKPSFRQARIFSQNWLINLDLKPSSEHNKSLKQILFHTQAVLFLILGQLQLSRYTFRIILLSHNTLMANDLFKLNDPHFLILSYTVFTLLFRRF
jgi:hypothetical protein